jgi:hypothetical protein
VEIAAPVDRVQAYLADVPKRPEWAPTDTGGTRLTRTIRMHQARPALEIVSRLVFRTTPEGMATKAQRQGSLDTIKAILAERAAPDRVSAA